MIIPAILEKDWAAIEVKLNICRGFASTVHIDFIDGEFVNNTSFLEFDPFKQYSNYFTLEAHLMVEEPVNYLDRLAQAGFKRYLGHIEKMSDQIEFVAKGEQLGSVGLALDLPTPIDAIKVPFSDLDQVLLMSVPAGLSGQTFDPEVLSKINSLSNKSFTNIEMDGGINDQTLPLAKKEGASMFCVTSFLFNSSNPEDRFHKLQAL